MKHLSLLSIFAGLSAVVAQAQCEADTTVYLTDFIFTPSEITISVGQTIAFVNAEGTHNVDGTAEGNPVSFFLEETEGNISGVCMGTVTFDVPGVYTFTSSIGVQPQLGMTGTIVVDAVTLADRMVGFFGSGDLEELDAFYSAWAFLTYYSSVYWDGATPNEGWTGDLDLNGAPEYTVFVPTDEAVDDLMNLMNLSQFDMLAFYDMLPALKYHIVPGIYMASDLEDGMELPTAEGQSVSISIGDAGAIVDDANIIYPDITAFNGVIHVIDHILVPAGYPGATTWDVIVQSPDHTILEQALLAEGLDNALRGQPILNDNEPAEGPFTVFAPTDDAFFALAEANGFESVQALLGSQFIDDILDAHLVEAVYESGDLYNGQNLPSYNNSGIVNITLDDEGIEANTAPIIQADMLAYNGVVHSLGEVMPFDFPDPEGTCGAWTIIMTCSNGGPSGWEGSSLHVFANGSQIAAETMMSVGSESFSIPVDDGSRIDVVYNDQGWGEYHGYSVIDQNGTTLFSSSGTQTWDGGEPPISVYGLNPCGEEPSCGLIEITFTDNSYDGWYGGSMGVFSESGLEANIYFNPDFDGDGYADYQSFEERTVMVTVDEGEIDFLVSSPVVYPTQCGYIVKNPAGEVAIDETSTSEAPPSTLNFVICETTASLIGEAEGSKTPISLYPNPVTAVTQLQGFDDYEAWEAEILSVDGKVVHRQRGVGNGTLDVFILPNGLYTIRLQSEDSWHTLRFVKE
ncbi:MAG: fasciclin domain-containing protein [Flavobacteriales bacterium]